MPVPALREPYPTLRERLRLVAELALLDAFDFGK
jgi:hypothetical protein